MQNQEVWPSELIFGSTRTGKKFFFVVSHFFKAVKTINTHRSSNCLQPRLLIGVPSAICFARLGVSVESSCCWWAASYLQSLPLMKTVNRTRNSFGQTRSNCKVLLAILA